ncbi:MAG: non-homologous end-joining DNA ligase [Candidatus Eremiobacteraeota bacterium]|nr:non-homologous end-joining DNA ligase [Candidatus Eremiobacteraeota bacterium]MBV8353773.1 non-homologous end-joining DNA ligase [Candidatus Eremiobacteraeota bacterium]
MPAKTPARKRTEAHLTVGKRELTLSNQDKVLFPDDGYTKGDLVAYYRAVAPVILPYLRSNPLTMERFPDGIDIPRGIWEKQLPRYTPEWIGRATIPPSTGEPREVTYLVVNDEASLVWVANLAAITLHIWYSHVPTLDTPDVILFDLDPGEKCPLARLAKVALAFRDELETIGLRAYVKTTGGMGLHVIVPLAPKYDYDVAKGVSELLARHINAVLPDDTTLERTIKRRPENVVYLDWVQVGKGKTYVAPFSVRARNGAPVSMPLAWAEVETMRRKRAPETTAEMRRWTIANVPELVAEGDPWRREGWKPQALEAALKRARSLWTLRQAQG